MGLFTAVLSVARGDWLDAVYTGVVAFALLIGGSVWQGRAGVSGEGNRDA